MTVEILNPIEPGQHLDEKQFILDTKIRMDDNTIINVELQLWEQSFWKDRALSYLSRLFDSLKAGESYHNTKQAIHVGILDFVLKDLSPEYYAEYLMKNRKNNEVFSDKFRLHVLCLKHLQYATTEDEQYGLVMWGRFFTATTWEDLKMLVKDYPVMEKPIAKVFEVTEESKIREMIELREEAIRIRKTEEELYRQGREERDAAIKRAEEAEARAAKVEQELQQAKQKFEQLRALLQEKGIDLTT